MVIDPLKKCSHLRLIPNVSQNVSCGTQDQIQDFFFHMNLEKLLNEVLGHRVLMCCVSNRAATNDYFDNKLICPLLLALARSLL